MAEWVFLKEIADIIMGQSPVSSTYNDKGKGLPFFQGKTEFGNRNPVVRKWCAAPLKVAEPGDILLSVRAPVGPTNICNVDACIGRGLAAIRCKEATDYMFLWFYLRSIERRVAQKGVGSTFAAIGRRDISKIRIPKIGYDSQRKIASILQKAESAIQKRKQANRLTDEFLKSTFIEMFGDPIINSKHWKMEKLGEALDVRDGTHDTPKYIPEGIPLVTSKNLQDGEIDFENVSYISREDHKNIAKRSYVERGDILYGMIGTIGSPVIVNIEREFSIKNVALFKFKGRKISNRYIATLIRDELLTRKLLAEKRGGTQKFVSLDILRNFKIPIPPFELQQKFASLAQRVEKLKQKQKESEKELNTLFNALMQKAFREKKRVRSELNKQMNDSK